MAKHSLTFYNNGVTLRKYGGTATDMYFMERDWWNTAHIMFPMIMKGNLTLVRKCNGRKYVCGRFLVDKFGGITNADVNDQNETGTSGIQYKITCG